MSVKKNKVLVIGGGGREHAIIHKINQSPLLGKVFCIPGNAGIEKVAECHKDIDIADHQAVIDFCRKKHIDLVIIGPEKPLVSGLVDNLTKAGIKAFGPGKEAARLEGSKAFTKKICDDCKIPTAKYQTFKQEDLALNYLKKVSAPCVIKADGIANGKGVIIALNMDEAVLAVKEIFSGKFGEAGKTIIIEEFLEGVEVSFFAICDGKNAKFLGTAGDHKKVGEGDVGANTGGMGTYSPSPFVDEKLQVEIMDIIIKPTMQAMQDLGCPFTGILFAGLILTKEGPKLLEFNTRFGDPETQSLLPRLKTDLLELMLAAVAGNLEDYSVEFTDQSVVCVVLAAKGYPENYQNGSVINNLSTAEKSANNILIFHAGTKKEDKKIIASGGRVLGVVALANDIALARISAYKAVDLIDWSDGFCRRDIGVKALVNYE